MGCRVCEGLHSPIVAQGNVLKVYSLQPAVTCGSAAALQGFGVLMEQGAGPLPAGLQAPRGQLKRILCEHCPG